MFTRLLLSSALLISACAPIPEGEADAGLPDAGAAPDTVAVEKPLFGEPLFTDCGAAQTQKLEDAVDWIIDRTAQPEFSECLRQAFGVEAEGRMVEHLVADLRSALSLHFVCVDEGCGNSVACAGANDEEERMTLENAWIVDTSLESLGAVVMHEMAHNHRWWHDFFYGPTWPDQVQVCAGGLEPWSNRRRDLGGQVALPHLGGEGGQAQRLACGDASVMVGVHGQVDGAGRLARLAPVCQRVDGFDLVGPVTHAFLPRARGMTSFDDRCRAGHVVVGVDGYADRFVSRVNAICAPLYRLKADDDGAVFLSGTPLRGRGRGLLARRRCPNRKAGVALRVRTGQLLDRVELECDDFPIGQRRIESTTAGAGGWGGSPFRRDCEGHGVFDGLYMQADPNTGWLASIGGRCDTLSRAAATTGEGWGSSIHYTERAGQTVPEEGLTVRRDCDDGEVMVGLYTGSEQFVRVASPICAVWNDWRDGDDTAEAVPTGWSPGEDTTSQLCPQGQVVVALEGRAGALVDRLSVRCAEPDGTGSVRALPEVGGPGAEPFAELCPQGRALVGLHTREEGGRLEAVTGQCGRHTANGTSVHFGVRLPTQRPHGDASVLDRCAHGQVLVGLDIWVSPTDTTNAARILCADEDALLQGDISPALHAGPVRGGALNGGANRQLCPLGEVVRGLRGRRDLAGGVWEYHALGLLCGKPTLRPGADVQGVVTPSTPEVWPLHIPYDHTGDFRVIVDSATATGATIRVRRGLEPTDDVAPWTAVDDDGHTVLYVSGVTLTEDLWFIEVGSQAGKGLYTLGVDLLPGAVAQRRARR